MYHYLKLEEMYLKSTSKTRNKCILFPKMEKVISDKNSYIVAIKTFNNLPNELKCLNLNNNSIKNKVKSFIVSG